MYATGYYRFGSNSDTPVRCVYVSCHHDDNDMCIFTSPEDGNELQVSMSYNPLQSSDNCVVNYVEMIHDCKPRRVDLILNFTSYPGNDNLYLQVSFATAYIYVLTMVHVEGVAKQIFLYLSHYELKIFKPIILILIHMFIMYSCFILDPCCCTIIIILVLVTMHHANQILASYLANILQLHRTTPLSYLEGELFKADVTCDHEGGNGKLYFKHNGTRDLLEKGS